jgi:hypothetical protein
MAIVEAIRKKDNNDKKFLAAINGVDLDEEAKEPEDVAALKNAKVASDEGFGVGEGLGFMQMGVDS